MLNSLSFILASCKLSAILPNPTHIDWSKLEVHLSDFFNHLQDQKVDMSRWICGLGHGVLQHTPEENVRKTVQYIHDHYRY